MSTRVSINSILGIKQVLGGEKPAKMVKSKDNKNITITNNKNCSITTTVYNFNLFEKSQTINEAISKHFETLSSDPAIDDFAILKNGKPLFEINQSEFNVMSMPNKALQVPADEHRTIEMPAVLTIRKIVFVKGQNWEFIYNGFKISAKIEDIIFSEEVSKGKKFASGDQFKVIMLIDQILNKKDKYFSNNRFRIIKVIDHLPRHENLKLFPME
jgi:hypothetical protein